MKSRIDWSKWAFVIAAFVVCKVMALVVMGLSLAILEPAHDKWDRNWPPDEVTAKTVDPVNLWVHYDSVHYIALVDRDYLQPLTPEEQDMIVRAQAGETFSVPQSLHRFTFGPAYPLIGKIFAPAFGPGGALMLVSNLAFLACIALLYDLTQLVFGKRGEGGRRAAETDSQTAGDSTGSGGSREYVPSVGKRPFISAKDASTWLLVLPSAFLLQAILTESLFLAFVLGAFVLAERKKWFWVIIPAVGFALTRSSGFLIALPLALIAVRQTDWKIWKLDSWKHYLHALPGVLAPAAAWFGFMYYAKIMTGDLFAYSHLQHAGWFVQVGPPTRFFEVLSDGILETNDFKALSVILMGVILLLGLRLIPISYQATGWLLLLVPLMISDKWAPSIWRYAVELFPMTWILAYALRRDQWRSAGFAAAAALQGVLLLAWTASWLEVII